MKWLDLEVLEKEEVKYKSCGCIDRSEECDRLGLLVDHISDHCEKCIPF